MVAPAVRFAGEEMQVHFDRFDLEAYDVFLKVKALPEYRLDFHEEHDTYTVSAPARFAGLLGIAPPRPPVPELTLSPFLFDDQAAITAMGLAAKRFACWSDCGNGKTLIGLEWGRHVHHLTGGPVLYFTRNEIVNQWLEEAKRWYGDALPLLDLHTRDEMKWWATGGWQQGTGTPWAITNYEKLNPGREGIDGQTIREFQGLAGVCLDEGDRLRTAGGRQKWALIHSCEQTEYKLILTATPAPNDLAEFLSQAGFLNKFRAEDTINEYFRRDEKSHRWTVKPHARAAFFRWMSSWSIYVRDPRRYGWRAGFADIPPPIVTVHEIEPTSEQLAAVGPVLAAAGNSSNVGMFVCDDLSTIQRNALSQVAKGFRYRNHEEGRDVERIPSLKPAFVAELIKQERKAGHKVLVWVVFDAEAEIIDEALRAMKNRRGDRLIAFDVLSGRTPKSERAGMLERFRRGDSTCLIGKASMLGYGMNLQHCTSMIFSGWNDSYVAYYQAVRRAYRYGQTQRLRVHLPVIPDLEGDQLDNIMRKQDQHEAAIAEMESNYIAAMMAEKVRAA